MRPAFAVVFQDRLAQPNALSLARLDAAGVRTKRQLITDAWTGYVWTSAAWGGDRLALASSEAGITFRLADCP